MEEGVSALEHAKKNNPGLKQIKIVAPHITFSSGSLSLRVGKKNLILSPMPGHSDDGLVVLVEEDRILFAGDTFMPLPFFIGGNIDLLANSLKEIGKMGLENIVQGHGDIILRGEIEEACKENLSYLATIRKAAKTALKKREPEEYLAEMDVEACGKSRVILGGLAGDLHRRNLMYLYRTFAEQEAVPDEKPL
jgi:glyoxylase-like metal-dependent hydrolase (beta-lactamase superfamily II)